MNDSLRDNTLEASISTATTLDISTTQSVPVILMPSQSSQLKVCIMKLLEYYIFNFWDSSFLFLRIVEVKSLVICVKIQSYSVFTPNRTILSLSILYFQSMRIYKS